MDRGSPPFGNKAISFLLKCKQLNATFNNIDQFNLSCIRYTLSMRPEKIGQGPEDRATGCTNEKLCRCRFNNPNGRIHP